MTHPRYRGDEDQRNMMAETAVSLVVTKLSDVLIEEAALLTGVRDKVQWLRAELRWMECFLRDADAKRRKGNDLVNNWVREVREVARRAEDIIDTFILEIDRRRRHHRRTGFIGRIKRYACFFPSELIARHNVGVQIQRLRSNIDQITASRERFGLINLGETTGESTDETLQSRRRIYPHLNDETDAVGLDAHKNMILQQLMDPDIARRFVMSIVGAGGLGKTTLANKIYNSSEVRIHFDTCACVSVSQDHKIGELLKKIAKQVMSTTAANELERVEVDDLRERLYNFLKERSYFIVLDDVWRTDVWKQLRTALPDVKNGSRVLITTRLMEVAISADPSIPPYQLPFLNEDESWELFLRKAFPENLDVRPRRCCPGELEDVGHQLVNRCGGLPLALLVLGGLISRKDPNPGAWMRVAERVDWASTEDGEESLKILGLSYDDLPHHYLRSCFVYLGVFPEDWEIDAVTLTRLWMAENLIPRTEGQMIENTAQVYLDELAQRSMIQVTYKKWGGSNTMYRIHDLFRDLCIREAREDGALNVDKTKIDRIASIMDDHTLRRLALHNLTTDNDEEDSYRPPSNLRSLLVFMTNVTSEMFNRLKLLRVIHLEHIQDFQILPEGIGSMIHLRYLSLKGCQNLFNLPSSIGNLSNLQTLDVSDTGIWRLPDALGKMQALRHMYLPSSCGCPPNIGSLTNLQTIKIARSTGGWIERSLEKLFNIRELSIVGLMATQGKRLLDSLGKQKHLTSLELLGSEIILSEFIADLSHHSHLHLLRLAGPMSHRQLPDHHLFPPNLTVLILGVSQLEQDPMATLEKLTNLTVLDLYVDSYIGKKMVCSSGGFPKLQKLSFVSLSGLEEWRVEAGAMPSITSLTIQYCSRLAMLPQGLQHVTSLRMIEVNDERKDFRDRLQPDVGEDWYKIRHVRSVTVDV